MPAKKPTIEETIAQAIEASKPEKRPFFSPKSPGLWASVGAIIVYGFTIFGNINGCFKSRYDKEHQLTLTSTEVGRLVYGDSIMSVQVGANTAEIQKIIVADSVDRYWKSIRKTRDSTANDKRFRRIESKLHIETD